MLHPSLGILLLTLSISLPTGLSAQIVGGGWSVRQRFDGQAADDRLGTSVADAGDVDGDGFPDIILGAYTASPQGRTWAGSAAVYSGASGLLLHSFDGEAQGDFFGHAVGGAGDVDADGIDDVIVGAYFADPNGLADAGSAYIYSGASGNLILRLDGISANHQFGVSVAGAGDYDGDGFDDLLVGAWVANTATIYSGATGNSLLQFSGSTWDGFGISVAVAGDVDADSVEDFIIGAYRASPAGMAQAGSAFVYSGSTGSLIYRFDGLSSNDWFGEAVAGAGDLDADGYDDLLIGASIADPGGRAYGGSAYVYSGANGQLIHQFDGEQDDRLGRSVCATGDIDGDGTPDLLIGAYTANTALLYSGASGELIHEFLGESWGDRFGIAVAAPGDLDGDGFEDLVIGASETDPGGLLDAGSVQVFGFDPYLDADVREVSAAAGATVTFHLGFPISDAGSRYRLLASASGTGPSTLGGLEIPLQSGDPFWDAMLDNPPPSMFSGATGKLDANGEATVLLTLLPGSASAVVGLTAHFAAVLFLPPATGLRSSVAVPVSVLP